MDWPLPGPAQHPLCSTSSREALLDSPITHEASPAPGGPPRNMADQQRSRATAKTEISQTVRLFLLVVTLPLTRGGFQASPKDLHTALFGPPCECRGGTRTDYAIPSSYTRTTDCGATVAYLAYSRTSTGVSQPEWVCVPKPTWFPPSLTPLARAFTNSNINFNNRTHNIKQSVCVHQRQNRCCQANGPIPTLHHLTPRR